MHPLLICDHNYRMLHKYHIFLQSIEDISVRLCSKNSSLQGKTLQKLAIKPQKAVASVGHWGLPSTYIYINTQKWFFEGGIRTLDIDTICCYGTFYRYKRSILC